MALVAKNPQLLLFTKAPEPGKVKTRLIHVLGANRAAQLHAFMTDSILSTLHASEMGAVQLWCAPGTDHPFFTQLQRQYSVSLHQQQGEDLGRRMKHALSHALQVSDAAIVIGSDCLQINANHLHDVAGRLNAGNDVVIVPARDGGYVLLGARRVDDSLFEGIHWGSNQVMTQTRQRLDQLQWRYSELPVQQDIDEPEDLIRLIKDPEAYSVSEALKEFLQSLNLLNVS